MLFGGWKWWDVQDSFYRRGLIHPLAVRASVATGPAGRTLTFTVTDPDWFVRMGGDRPDMPQARLNTLVPEHGKLMHMFLV